MKTHHHRTDFTKKKMTPQRLAAIDREVEQELIPGDLRAARELLGKTQVDGADATNRTQSEVSRLEHRPEVRRSTLRRCVEGERLKCLLRL